MPTSSGDVTRLLGEFRKGNPEAQDELFRLIHSELRRVAARHLAGERPDHTLQPTALVHEAYLRLMGQKAPWQNRAQFFGIAAAMMRRILKDHARKRHSRKRGGDRISQIRGPIQDQDIASPGLAPDVLLALDEALTRLETAFPRHARIVEQHFYTGLPFEGIAANLGISVATAKRDWKFARAWLHHEMSGAKGHVG